MVLVSGWRWLTRVVGGVVVVIGGVGGGTGRQFVEDLLRSVFRSDDLMGYNIDMKGDR